jgi:hypothetical protein
MRDSRLYMVEARCSCSGQPEPLGAMEKDVL